MEIVRRPHKMSVISREARSQEKRISLVPTMGSLHDGHLGLVRRARDLSQLVVMSIFVNPAQFGPGEDLASYPRDLVRDSDLARESGVDILYVPQLEDVYPVGFQTYVDVEGIGSVLEGGSRPAHFRGVATVVTKLLNRVRPHVAVFGQKDAQQAVVIKKMVRDLEMDVEIDIGPTIREEDGLALSSRNAYLKPDERKAATVLYRALKEAEKSITEEKEKSAEKVLARIREVIEAEPLAKLDYVAVVDAESLDPAKEIGGTLLIPIAAQVGDARLIDNIIVKVEG